MPRARDPNAQIAAVGISKRTRLAKSSRTERSPGAIAPDYTGSQHDGRWHIIAFALLGFVPAADRGEGEVGLRFRPVRTRRNFLDILGTIWLDSATYLARRLELEYVNFDESRGTVRVDFAEVPVAGGTLRMPLGGAFAMRSSRKNPTRRIEGKFTYTYSGFAEVRPR